MTISFRRRARHAGLRVCSVCARVRVAEGGSSRKRATAACDVALLVTGVVPQDGTALSFVYGFELRVCTISRQVRVHRRSLFRVCLLGYMCR